MVMAIWTFPLGTRTRYIQQLRVRSTNSTPMATACAKPEELMERWVRPSKALLQGFLHRHVHAHTSMRNISVPA
jgi:hypothetical protein